MRPTLTSTVLMLLAALLVYAAPAALARDVPAPKPAQKPAVQDDALLAAEIGRALLSTEEAVRRTAVERLLARITQGGDLAGFLAAMNRATRAWADRHERLMEVWLHDAVHGDVEERERAVRLLTALGAKAIRRLAIELRHAQLHRPVDARPPPPRGARKATSADAKKVDEASSAEPVLPEELSPGTPRVYELADLFERGMNPVELRGLLQKEADAVEVKRFKTLYVVSAQDEGHRRLRDRLHDLRVSFRLEAADAAKARDEGGKGAAAPVGTEEAKPAPATPQEADVPQRDDTPQLADTPRPAAAAPVPAAGAQQGAAASWQLEPTLFHLPHTTLAAIVSARERAQSNRVLPYGLLGGTRDVFRTEDLGRARVWTRELRSVPDARTGLPLRGRLSVASGGTTNLFAGKPIQYSKNVRRTKGGAWTIVTGTIQHGIALDVTLRASATTLRVDVVATRTEVGLPIPVVRIRPSPRATPVELERPEWSTTRVRRSFDLPLQGGGALLSLEGLGSSPDDHVVLALTLRRPVEK